jgi:GntR family transcriptional regulator
MLIVLDPHSGIPVYRQLMDQIRFHVATGLLSPGDELPSTRALSSQLGLNPMTVSKAYSFLEKEGVVERRPGLPLVVRAPEPREAQIRKLDQLRQSLVPTVTMVRQLGIAKAAALDVFDRMMDDGPPPGDEAGGATPHPEEHPQEDEP